MSRPTDVRGRPGAPLAIVRDGRAGGPPAALSPPRRPAARSGPAGPSARRPAAPGTGTGLHGRPGRRSSARNCVNSRPTCNG